MNPFRAYKAMAYAALAFGTALVHRDALAMPAAVLDARQATWEAEKFPVADALRPTVTFWREVFLRYEQDQALIHDTDDMRLVWGVLDLPRDTDGAIDERAAQKAMRDARIDFKDRLRRLARNRTPIDSQDETLLALAVRGGVDHLPGAHRRVRVQRGVADHFRAGRQRATQWLLQIKGILEEESVPAELAALPFVESMFNPRARSSAGAAGIWQLMRATARGLGLRVRRGDDERYDILKATRAAAQMLMANYRMLGSWPLALTAYNHGPYGVRRAVDAVGSTDLSVLIDRYNKETWGFASKNFYAEFVAVLEILAEDPAFATSLALNEGRSDGSEPALHIQFQ